MVCSLTEEVAYESTALTGRKWGRVPGEEGACETEDELRGEGDQLQRIGTARAETGRHGSKVDGICGGVGDLHSREMVQCWKVGGGRRRIIPLMLWKNWRVGRFRKRLRGQLWLGAQFSRGHVRYIFDTLMRWRVLGLGGRGQCQFPGLGARIVRLGEVRESVPPVGSSLVEVLLLPLFPPSISSM